MLCRLFVWFLYTILAYWTTFVCSKAIGPVKDVEIYCVSKSEFLIALKPNSYSLNIWHSGTFVFMLMIGMFPKMLDFIKESYFSSILKRYCKSINCSSGRPLILILFTSASGEASKYTMRLGGLTKFWVKYWNHESIIDISHLSRSPFS